MTRDGAIKKILVLFPEKTIEWAEKELTRVELNVDGEEFDYAELLLNFEN